MRLHLGGHLNWYDPEKRDWLEWDPPHPLPLAELLALFKIPAGEVALCVINGEVRPLEEALVSDEDRVELYPPMAGGVSI